MLEIHIVEWLVNYMQTLCDCNSDQTEGVLFVRIHLDMHKSILKMINIRIDKGKLFGKLPVAENPVNLKVQWQ